MKDALSHLKPKALACLAVLLTMQFGQAAATMPKDMVAAHNEYRSRVGSPALAWAADLAKRAQEWATKLIEAGTYAPRNDGQSGENLFEISGGTASPKQVVAAWASEEANYDHAANKCRSRCGHFTQVVWRGSKTVGCGSARANGREVWVCDYDPPGNVVGERPY